MARSYLYFGAIIALAYLVTGTTVMAGQEIISGMVKEAPILDGMGTDPAWQSAKTYTVRDKRLDLDITLKSVHTNEMVFFYVRFPDATESKIQKPWVWNGDMEVYTISEQLREDTFIFRWNMEDHDVDLADFSDDNFNADVWYWKADRSNQVGYADDKLHRLSDVEAKKSRLIMSATGRKRYLLRLADGGRPMYKEVVEVDYKGDIIPQYIQVVPGGSRADVRAGGAWRDGAWTIEFGRKLQTGYNDDVQFELTGKKYLFGVSVKPLYGEPIDDKAPNLYGQGRISEPLYLVLQ